MSEIMQLGCGDSFSNNSSAGCCSMQVEAIKSVPNSSEGNLSRLSHPSGIPASSQGNQSEMTWIWSPDSTARAKLVSKRTALCVVVITVTTAPLCANNLAMSIIGIMWPWAMRGNKIK